MLPTILGQRLSTLDDVNRFGAAVAHAWAALLRRPLIDAAILHDVALTTTPRPVAHTLGRALVGWIVVRRYAQVDVWEDAALVVPSSTIALVASADVIVDLAVF